MTLDQLLENNKHLEQTQSEEIVLSLLSLLTLEKMDLETKDTSEENTSF